MCGQTRLAFSEADSGHPPPSTIVGVACRCPISVYSPVPAAGKQVPAAADREHWAKCLANDAACLPFGMVGEPRRKLGPITTLVLLLR